MASSSVAWSFASLFPDPNNLNAPCVADGCKDVDLKIIYYRIPITALSTYEGKIISLWSYLSSLASFILKIMIVRELGLVWKIMNLNWCVWLYIQGGGWWGCEKAVWMTKVGRVNANFHTPLKPLVTLWPANSTGAALYNPTADPAHVKNTY